MKCGRLGWREVWPVGMCEGQGQVSSLLPSAPIRLTAEVRSVVFSTPPGTELLVVTVVKTSADAAYAYVNGEQE